MVTQKLIGAERLLQALDPARANSALRDGLKKAANIVLRAAKENAGGAVLKRRSGRLTTSIKSVVDLSGLRAMIGLPGKGKYTPGGYKRGEADVGLYGAVNEFGATIRPLPPNKYLKFRVAERGVRVSKKVIGAGEAPFVSVRQVVIPARPWLRPALAENADEISAVFRASLQRSLRP